MNEIDPARRFSIDAVRQHDGNPEPASKKARLNKIAEQVASQYRRDTMSPVMVSGVLRMVEFGLLFASGIVLYAIYVGPSTHLFWHYPVAVLAASLFTILVSKSRMPTRSRR